MNSCLHVKTFGFTVHEVVFKAPQQCAWCWCSQILGASLWQRL